LLLHATIGLLSRHDQDLKSIYSALQIGILLRKEFVSLLQMRNVLRRFGQDRRLCAQSAHTPPIRGHHGRHLAQGRVEVLFRVTYLVQLVRRCQTL
jgi:hypothetical protein